MHVGEQSAVGHAFVCSQIPRLHARYKPARPGTHVALEYPEASAVFSRELEDAKQTVRTASPRRGARVQMTWCAGVCT